ncbi:MAG: type II secretion system protein [Bacillota bacterium]
MSTRGFTLLEIVAALAILGVALAILLSGISQAMFAHREALERGQAMVIAESQLQSYLAGDQAALQGRMTAGEGPEYRWYIRTVSEGEGLSEVIVTVEWTGLRARRRLEISALKGEDQ